MHATGCKDAKWTSNTVEIFYAAISFSMGQNKLSNDVVAIKIRVAARKLPADFNSRMQVPVQERERHNIPHPQTG
jgi:hypothetical protein